MFDFTKTGGFNDLADELRDRGPELWKAVGSFGTEVKFHKVAINNIVTEKRHIGLFPSEHIMKFVIDILPSRLISMRETVQMLAHATIVVNPYSSYIVSSPRAFERCLENETASHRMQCYINDERWDVFCVMMALKGEMA